MHVKILAYLHPLFLVPWFQWKQCQTGLYWHLQILLMVTSQNIGMHKSVQHKFTCSYSRSMNVCGVCIKQGVLLQWILGTTLISGHSFAWFQDHTH